MIGAGSGTTARVLAECPTVERVEVVEIEEAVIEAGDYFKGINNGVYDHPKVEVFINDRQAVVQRHLHKPEDVGICLHSEGGDLEADVTAWKMAASNQW